MTEQQAIPFLDIAAQNAEVVAEVLPAWEELFETAAFVGGPAVDQFESEFAAFTGVRHCIGVANGTDALELAMRAVGVMPGGEVIVPVNTFVATAEAVSRIGARPIFVDVDDEQLLIQPPAVEAAITPRTQAIVPVHLYGQVSPVDSLTATTVGARIPIVEDNAQAQGASGTEGRTGALGAIAATSFYPGKNLGAAGDAGAVTTNDAELAHAVRSLGAHGSSVKYVHDRIGVNSRLDALQAVVLSAKLRRLEEWNARRRVAAAAYAELLGPLEASGAIRLPRSRAGSTDVWHLYVIRILAASRDRVLDALLEQGIGAAIHYPTPLHLTGAYAGAGYRRGQFPIAETAAEQILSLPMFPHITRSQQERVADALASVNDALSRERMLR
ncbi:MULTISPECIES: DegT/DnrJ/EryC1/StrS family aminotransferase [unclassified Diaminobutyricimonas]|uniref:DegT/DnrJ/EryC1/StrS family aminotransferase n=1 Tax=unclassified Diaminobutyricimonas TaxID=2643261 RepID=UPI0012F4F028|nr:MULTISPECIES: DegT/DnrJ/EryC1/StrS family aminotransferase [unclassified Diaminobutyricimonas]